MDSANANRINCLKCAYYAVTWEPAQPRSCKFYGFKSAEMPSVVVLKTSGSDCMAYKPKGNSAVQT